MRALEEVEEVRRVPARTLRLRLPAMLVFGRRVCDVCGREVELGEGVPLEVRGVVGCDVLDELRDGAVGIRSLGIYALEYLASKNSDAHTLSVKVKTVSTWHIPVA